MVLVKNFDKSYFYQTKKIGINCNKIKWKIQRKIPDKEYWNIESSLKNWWSFPTNFSGIWRLQNRSTRVLCSHTPVRYKYPLYTQVYHIFLLLSPYITNYVLKWSNVDVLITIHQHSWLICRSNLSVAKTGRETNKNYSYTRNNTFLNRILIL